MEKHGSPEYIIFDNLVESSHKSDFGHSVKLLDTSTDWAKPFHAQNASSVAAPRTRESIIAYAAYSAKVLTRHSI